MSLGPPSLLTSALNRETSVCSLNTLAMSSLMTCRRKKGTSRSQEWVCHIPADSIRQSSHNRSSYLVGPTI